MEGSQWSSEIAWSGHAPTLPRKPYISQPGQVDFTPAPPFQLPPVAWTAPIAFWSPPDGDALSETLIIVSSWAIARFVNQTSCASGMNLHWGMRINRSAFLIQGESYVDWG
jgi:hypothetical protein